MIFICYKKKLFCGHFGSIYFNQDVVTSKWNRNYTMKQYVITCNMYKIMKTKQNPYIDLLYLYNKLPSANHIPKPML